jgi:catechol 2,3-dioxygenase-like lactoylglutathione lyase family enzyme
VTLDLSELTFIDSTGVGAILEHAGSLDGAKLVLSDPSAMSRRICEIVGMQEHPVEHALALGFPEEHSCTLAQPEVRTPDDACRASTGDLANRKNGRVALQRMDNVGIVVESLEAAISFFAELGLELEGRAMIEGDWSGRVTGLRDQRVEIAMMRTPDGHGRIELSRFLAPSVVADHRDAPVNALGYLRVMFAVDDLDDTLARLRRHGARLVGEVVQYEDVYRLCYVRGPEGILIGLAEQLG